MFQRAVDKAIAAIPTLVGPVIERYGLKHVFASGDTDVLGCTVGYELGIDDINFKVDLRPPTSFGMVFKPGHEIDFSFDIQASGGAYPYLEGHFCGWEPDAGPTISASRIYGSMQLVISVGDDRQIHVAKANLDAHLGYLHVDLGPITWLLDLVGLQEPFDNWLRDIVMSFASDIMSDELPGIIEKTLRDKLRFDTAAEGFDLQVALTELSTTWGSLTLQADTGLFPIVTAPCPEGGNCVSPSYAPGFGTPNDHPTADAAVAITLPAMNQALFAAFRSGKLEYKTDMDAAEVLGAIIPGVPVSGMAHISAHTLNRPTITYAADGSTDPVAHISKLQAHIVVDPSSTIGALDITITTSLEARAIIELTPPYLGEDPNPVGNQVRVRMTDFVLGETTMESGPTSGLLTDQERDLLLTKLILPMYESKVGILPLTSSILDFKVPGTNRRAALHVVEKQRIADAVAVYVIFDISPIDDNVPPTAKITKVEGITPNYVTREVMIPKKEAIVAWTGNDDRPEYETYMQFSTSLDLAGWTDRQYLRTIKLSNLDEGPNWFYVRSRDFANNLSIDPTTNAGEQGAVRITVDTLPPSTTISEAPPAYTNDTSALFKFLGVDGGSGIKDFMIAVDNAASPIVSSATSRTLMSLSEGPHAVLIKARDRVNNIDPVGAPAIFTVDLTSPSTHLNGPRTGYVKPAAARFNIDSADNLSPITLMQYGYQLSGPSCATSGFTSFSGYNVADVSACNMTDGVYTLTARAKDAAGNIDTIGSQTSFTVDGTPPSLQLLEHPDARSSDRVLEFLASASDNFSRPDEISYAYRLLGLSDDYSVGDTNPHISLEFVPSGDYVFQLRATDLADNYSEISEFRFSLDNGAPTTSLDEALPEYITDTTFGVKVSGSDDRSAPDKLRYAVSIDGTTTVMTAPVSLADLPEGLHTMHISSVDEFDNRDLTGVSTNFTIDRTPPETNLARPITHISPGTLKPSIGGSDNLTAENELRYTYRITRPNTEPTQWSAPKSKDDFAIFLRERGPIVLELAAVDNAGLVDGSPLVIKGNVAPVTGCDCSSTERSPDEVAGSLALIGLFVVRYFRRRSR